MNIGITINKLRNEANLTQAQFAEIIGVSQQSVQKWESGVSTPDLDKIVMISKYFDVSLDVLVMGNDNRIVEEMNRKKLLKPQYRNMHDWEFYSSNLLTEYTQSTEEGLDIEVYKDLFSTVARLPKGEMKKKIGDLLFEIVHQAKPKEGYRYIEPSDLDQIRRLRKKSARTWEYKSETLESKIHGAWMGRICGCMLGKTVEGIRTNELVPFLKETDNYPMHRYIYRKDITKEIIEKYKFGFAGRIYADEINAMPVDDDTNYVVLAQRIIDRYGFDFTPMDVSKAWLRYQSKDAYCTAERVAFCNFVKGYAPPEQYGFQQTDCRADIYSFGVLLRYLAMRLSGDPQAERLLLRAQDAPDLSMYEAAVPLRFGPTDADPRYDERAGLLRRTAHNVAAVDAALARTVPAGAGMKRIERIGIVRT